jgi:hypothetical protein
MALRAVTAKDATLEFVSNQITGSVWYDASRPGTLVRIALAISFLHPVRSYCPPASHWNSVREDVAQKVGKDVNACQHRGQLQPLRSVYTPSAVQLIQVR